MLAPRKLLSFISNRFHPRQEERYLREIEGTTAEHQEVDERDFLPENLEIVGTSAENQEVDERHFLPENLELILTNLNVGDLCRAAAVNKLWNELATRELKQRELRISVLPVTNVNFCDAMRTTPYVALMFVAPKEVTVTLDRSDWMKSLQLDVLKKYKNFFSKYLVILGMCRVSMDKEFITTDNEMSEGGIVSLLIPEYRDLEIRAMHAHYFEGGYEQEFLNEILPKDSQSPATFIIFTQGSYHSELLFKSLKRSMKKRRQKYTAWGGYFENGPFAAAGCQIGQSCGLEFGGPMSSYSLPYLLRYGDDTRIFAMSITGSCLESWSIEINHEMKRSEFKQKLMDFRDQLRLRRRSIGLACRTRLTNDPRKDFSDEHKTFSDALHAIKEIFPQVPFIGIHDYCIASVYCSPEEARHNPIVHDVSIALLILTFH